MRMRIGNGFDVHVYTTGQGLWLGGYFVEAPYALKGHSDADVLLHALTDAILGALGEGDIGTHFPDTDPRNKGRASSDFLALALETMKAHQLRLENIDITIIGQKPRLSEFRGEISKSLMSLTGLPSDAIGLKATTTEGLGFTGRGEGLAVQASVLLTE